MYLMVGIVASLLMLTYRRPAAGADGRVITAATGRASSNLGLYSSFAILTVVAASRYGIGTDYWARYVPLFERVQQGGHVDTEPGFLLINQLVAIFTSDSQWVIAVMSIATIGLMYRFSVRFSLNPALSIFVFVFGGFYLEGFNLVRQSLAIAIVLNTIEFIPRKRPLPFLSVTLLAATVHASALLWLAVWPLARLRGGRLTQLLLMCGALGALVAVPQIVSVLVTQFAPDYSWYFQSNYAGVQGFDPAGVLLALFVFVCTMAVSARGAVEDRYRKVIMNVQIVQIIAIVATLTISYAFSRITYYFSPIQMLAVPLLVHSITDPALRRITTAVVVGLYVVVFYFKFIVANAHGVMPYDSVLF